ncbi:ABC transporter permease [Legionella fairfieldensis]|uniref:ABC transporter permease n=1 Tax=Legionella fairfieldensis TaxID=45064 RepID=UPI00068858FA|nr:ABC transporter permease [Legionella fairfieldensis]
MSNYAEKIYISEKRKIMNEVLYAIKSWRVWMHMGFQDVRNQFKRSRLGMAWAFINLGLMAAGIGYIYGHLFHQDLSQFFPQLIAGLVIWTFLSTTIVQGCQAFIVSEGYVKQFPFPKQIYLLRFFLSALINFFIGLFIYFCVALIQNIPIINGAGWVLLGLFLLIMISMAHLVIFSYLGTKIRDLAPALSSLFLILFYVTPIIFTTDMLKERGLDFVYNYNPLYYLIEILRSPLLSGHSAEPFVYKAAICYGVLAWIVAIYTTLKCDRKVAYWL